MPERNVTAGNRNAAEEMLQGRHRFEVGSNARCLVLVNSFAECAPEPNPQTKKDVVWFALNELPRAVRPAARFVHGIFQVSEVFRRRNHARPLRFISWPHLAQLSAAHARRVARRIRAAPCCPIQDR
jgi:hypothetical protein